MGGPEGEAEKGQVDVCEANVPAKENLPDEVALAISSVVRVWEFLLGPVRVPCAWLLQ